MDNFLRLLSCLVLLIEPSFQVAPKSQAGCISDPADVVFLLDRSGSIGSQSFRKELEFVAHFARHYVIGPQSVQIGVVTFSGSPTKEFDLNMFWDINKLEERVMKISYLHDGTHTSKALKFVRENSFTPAAGKRPGVPSFLIVITDGMSQPEKFNPTTEAGKLHSQTNIEVFAIGVGNKISMDELKVIASDNNHVKTVDNNQHLHLPLREIRCEKFKDKVVTPNPNTPMSTTKVVKTTPTMQPTTIKVVSTTPTTQPTTTKVVSTTPTTQPTTTKGPVQCMGCIGIPEPHDCKTVITCAEHEQCSTDFYITPQGHVFYDLGCTANRVCEAISQYGRKEMEVKRQDANVHICQECCNTDNCNRFGCSEKADLNRTVCYSCKDVKHPSDCDEINICDIDKNCYARHFINDMFEERWSLGCESKTKCSDITKNSMFIGHPRTRRQIGGFGALDVCYYCCEDNFCNKYDCVKGLLADKMTTISSSTHVSSTNVYSSTTSKNVVSNSTAPTSMSTTESTPLRLATATTNSKHVTSISNYIVSSEPTVHNITTQPAKNFSLNLFTSKSPIALSSKSTDSVTTSASPLHTTQLSTTTAPFSCYHCEYTNHETECNNTEICSLGQDYCYLARVDGGDENDHYCFYKTGCMSKNNCDTYTSRMRGANSMIMMSSMDIVEHFECCNTPNCNEHVIKDHPPSCKPLPTESP